MYKVLKCNGEDDRYGAICTCENLEDARAIEYALYLALNEAGGNHVHFAILDEKQQAIIHKTKPPELNA